MKSEILNLKKSAKFRNEHEIYKGNRIVLIDENEQEVNINSAKNLNVEFKGGNSLIKIHKDLQYKLINIRMGEGAYLYIGKDCRIRHLLSVDLNNKNSTLIIHDKADIGSIKIYLEREPNLEVIIGSNFLAANNIELRTSDAHTIYSINNPKEAINKPSFGIHIGEHVWIGENVLVAKDVSIPKNCIIGACSFVCRKEFHENTIIAGVPAKTIKYNVNWDEKPIYRYEKT